ncbi:MAG: TldD/PmbA family protein [Candidatus Dadabacteria bacterium]|nr:MAG: TldD/PmbA family protein [Candidatus Dadabacteria bacterium]
MLSRSKIDKLVKILRKDLRRSMRMHIPGFPKIYYASFLLRDTQWFNTWASGGSTFRRRSDRTRNIYCDIRVGSYRYDQVTQGGLLDNDEEVESYNHVSVPIDDRDYSGLRLCIWRLTDAKYREAIAAYNERKSSSISTVDQNREFASFTKLPPIKSITYSRAEYVDEEKWVRFCKNISKWISDLPKVTSGWAEFDSSQVTKIFVNSEGSTIVQHSKVFSLCATLRHLTSQGLNLEQEIVFNCTTQRDFPTTKEFKALILEKHRKLLELASAKRIHSFSGPALLYPIPAGVLLHEALGHRLEGSRLLSTSEGQTFKGQIGKKIIKAGITVRDDPTLKKFNGKGCIGAYDYDDEGTPAQDTLLVEDGFLKGFLSTRAAFEKRGFKPNGHARAKKHERPISRMAVLIAEGSKPLSMEELKRKLIREVKRQRKPFGIIIYETMGGETETSEYDFQAFSGEISYAKLVYPDGSEVCVRGVDFVGTPLQALNNIIAIGDTQELHNGYCGAESGFIPVSTISPAILLSNLELQSKREELVTQYILPKPRV